MARFLVEMNCYFQKVFRLPPFMELLPLLWSGGVPLGGLQALLPIGRPNRAEIGLRQGDLPMEM